MGAKAARVVSWASRPRRVVAGKAAGSLFARVFATLVSVGFWAKPARNEKDLSSTGYIVSKHEPSFPVELRGLRELMRGLAPGGSTSGDLGPQALALQAACAR